MRQTLLMMTSYMAWANDLMLSAVETLPEAELVKARPTLFGNIAHTFNHILVIGDVFKAHLEGRAHGYSARNTEQSPPFDEVATRLRAMDRYYVDLAGTLDDEALAARLSFEFIGGGMGNMSPSEILLHLANHATYHRGFVSDLLYQIPFKAAANDLTVFLRDVWAVRS